MPYDIIYGRAAAIIAFAAMIAVIERAMLIFFAVICA